MERLDAILQAIVAQGDDTNNKVLGAAFVVTNKEGVLYSGAAGRIDLKADSALFDGDTCTWVASLTKLVTTTCLMQLVESNRIALDDDVRGLVPELAAMQILRGFTTEGQPILEDNVEPITLRHLLTHTVGLGYDLVDPDLVKWSEAIGRKASMRDWTKEGYTTPLKFVPGNGWWYGSALDWAGIVLEKVTGQTLGEYMKQHLLEPLGMYDSGFETSGHVAHTVSRFIDAYTIRDSDGNLKPYDYSTPANSNMESGGAGLCTTAHDYARIQRALLHDSPKVVSAETVKAMFTPQLSEQQREMLQAVCFNPMIKPGFGPEYPEGLPIDFGLGGVICMDDMPGMRRKGSLTWSGANNPRWWIDRKSGIAGVMVVNLFPHGDTVASSLFIELERAAYELFAN